MNYILLQDIFTNISPIVTTVSGGIVTVVGVIVASKVNRIKTLVSDVTTIKDDILGLKSAVHRSEQTIADIVTQKSIDSSIDNIVSYGLNYCADNKDIMPFCQAVGKALKDFTKDILSVGFENLSKRDINAKFNLHFDAIYQWHKRFDINFIKAILPKLRAKNCSYIAEVQRIKIDVINNKHRRLQVVTEAFIQDKISFFINEYIKYGAKRCK